MSAHNFSRLAKNVRSARSCVPESRIHLKNSSLAGTQKRNAVSPSKKCVPEVRSENLEETCLGSTAYDGPERGTHGTQEKMHRWKNENEKNNALTSDNPAVLEPLPTRTEPPEPGSTAPFNQEALDAVKAGAGCWVWSGVLNEWLFWVRDDERKAKATSRGIDPGCIWTLAEITGVQGMPPEGLRDVAAIKRQFGGTVQPGEVPARWRDAFQPLEPVQRNQQEANNQIVECRTCLRYGPRDHYCGHKLRHIREGEGPICSGKGYSPKGEPWKDDRS